MKVRFLVLLFAILANAEITSEAEYIQAVNTPNGLNKCFGARMEKGHNAEYMACVRRYFPKCVGYTGKFSHVDISKCVMNSDAVNVSQKDIQRQKQIEEWKEKHK